MYWSAHVCLYVYTGLRLTLRLPELLSTLFIEAKSLSIEPEACQCKDSSSPAEFWRLCLHLLKAGATVVSTHLAF